jgi:hypothetical protein
LALHLRDLAGRAGRQWGGGYVEPHEAAYELLAEVVQPYLDDLERRARARSQHAATEIGLSLLLGLYKRAGGSRGLPGRGVTSSSIQSLISSH